MNKKIGAAIKKVRQSSGFTAEALARSLGHTPSWIFDIESGRRNVNFKDARAICKKCGVSIDYLSNIIDSL